MVPCHHGGDEHPREYVSPKIPIPRSTEYLPGCQAWFLALTYSPFNYGQYLIVTNSLLFVDICPEACSGVVDKREALNMYESFEQFTSSPADQRTEQVQYVLVLISSSQIIKFYPRSPAVVKMFESSVSTLVEAINVQRQGNVSKIRVSTPLLAFAHGGWTPPVDSILSWGSFFGISVL